MTLGIQDIFFGVAAILLAIEFSQNKSLTTAAMALVAIGLIFAI